MRGTLEFTTGELFYLLCGRLALHSSVAQLSRIKHLLQITLLLASCLSHGEHCNYQLLAIISHLSFRIFWCHHLHGHAVNNWFIAYFSCLIGALYTNESSEAWKISRLMFLIWGWKFSVLMILLILTVCHTGEGLSWPPRAVLVSILCFLSSPHTSLCRWVMPVLLLELSG